MIRVPDPPPVVFTHAPHHSTHKIPSMRPSVASSLRSSIAAAPPSAETLAGLNQKKKEAEAVDALQRASALFLQRLEGLADDCEAMADAGAGARFFLHSHPWFLSGTNPEQCSAKFSHSGRRCSAS